MYVPAIGETVRAKPGRFLIEAKVISLNVKNAKLKESNGKIWTTSFSKIESPRGD